MAIVGGVAAAGIGAAGSVMSADATSSAQQSAAQNANAPWSAAQPYISGQFGNAQTALQNAQNMGVYGGERVAGLNPYQTQAADAAGGWANGNGAASANGLYSSGMGMLGAGQQFNNNAGQLYGNSQTNQTQNFLNTAGQYANNPYVNQMIDAANMDVSRDLNETQLPSLALTAAGAGNTDSTRTGVESALLQSRAQQNMLNNASTIRGNMFNTGLNMAQSQYNTQQSQALSANQQLGSGYGMGMDSITGANNLAGNNFNLGSQAGGVYQGQQQAQDQAAYNTFQEQQNTPMNLIGQYMNVINGKWGGPAISSTGPSAGAAGLQGGLGAGLMGYGLMNQYGSGGTTDYGGLTNGAASSAGNMSYSSAGNPIDLYGMGGITPSFGSM